MAWRIVRQPNGKLARFSDIVDNFTHYNMDEGEATELCQERMSKTAAIDKVKRGMVDEPMPPFVVASGKNDGLDRYRDCLKTIRNVHGKKEADEAERLLS